MLSLGRATAGVVEPYAVVGPYSNQALVAFVPGFATPASAAPSGPTPPASPVTAVGGASSSTIVAVPTARPIVASFGFDRKTTNCSSGSSSASPTSGTDTAYVSLYWKLSSGGAIATVPLEAVKSAGAVADPGTVAQSTEAPHTRLSVVHASEGFENVTVNVATREPPSPSVTTTSLIDTAGAVSSSTIVPIPVARPMVPDEPSASWIWPQSFLSGSFVLSPVVGTTNVVEESPGWIERWPPVDWKST